MKINLNQTQKFYLINFCIIFTVLFSIYTMFQIQFMVIDLQSKADKADSTIVAYKDEIKVLEVEWVYLTRPERLRNLAEKYLQNNSSIASNQIKNPAKLEQYYIASLEKYESKQITMDENSLTAGVN